jgi:hypothetical protein
MDHMNPEFTNGARIIDEYRVFNCFQKISRNGNPYTMVVLNDANRQLLAYGWPGRYQGPSRLDSDTILRINATAILHDHNWRLNLESIDIVDAPEKNPALLLPAGTVVSQNLIDRLALFADEITIPGLRRFIRRVLSDAGFIRQFAIVPASVNNHHHHLGGTLEHSLECVDVIRHLPGLSLDEREVALVAAFLHDAGKIRTHTLQGFVPQGFWVHHNDLTLEVLAHHLTYLDQEWPDASFMLRHIWSSLHKGSTQRRSSLAKAVAHADQYSAERAQEKKVFARLQPWKTHAKDIYGNQLIRLKQAA